MSKDHLPQKRFRDVRMRGFSSRATVEQALDWVDARTAQISANRSAEIVPLAQLADRVLAKEVVSAVDVPGFDRAMMDGFALQASDTAGASIYNRLPLRVTGELLAGTDFDGQVLPGTAVRIMTGAALPTGADAVIPVEKTESDRDQLFVLDEVSPGKHVGRRGEDIACGTTVLAAGRRLRPQDLGVLSSIGEAAAPVVRRPRVRIVVTGNEVLPPGSRPSGHQVSDANGPMLQALVERDGGISINPGIVPDDADSLLAAMQDDADVVLISGGSSVGQEDHAPALLAEYGELAIHGIAMRPSSPAGMGELEGQIVFLLPGNPVSCLCAYDFFAGRAVRTLAGRQADWPYPATRLALRRKLVSTVGRVDYARVKITHGQVEPLAIGGASVLSSTTRADGFVVVPSDSEGYPAGSEVAVYLYDRS